MAYNPEKHRRRSIRLKGYDYTLPGAYFVTLVAFERDCLFGEIVNRETALNGWGFVALTEWRRLEQRFESVNIGDFVVMPNHLHGILWIAEKDQARAVGAGQEKFFLSGESHLAPPLRASRGATLAPLGTIVGAYKSTAARLINGLRHTPGVPVWQRNYYEHIIRNNDELAHIIAYIQSNPAHWSEDQENPHYVRAE